MSSDIYRRLQQHLDNHPIPFPETKSGTEITLLKSLFSEEEAFITLELSTLLERPPKIYKRLKAQTMSFDEFEKKIYEMFKKGIIRGVKDRKNVGKFLYSKMPLAIGMFEAQVDQITNETAKNFFEYEKDGFADAVIGRKTNQMRTIPLNIRVDPEFHVSNYDDITAIIKSSPGPFAVMNCVCRQAKDAMENSCKVSDIRETCILLEGGVDFAMNMGVGKEIDKRQALKIITQAKKSGFVLQPENSQHPHFVCCCCGCCCGVLSAAKMYDKPAEYLHSNYFASVDTEKCSLCEKCVERCPMDAFDKVENAMKIKVDWCIGCAACVPTCKDRAIGLIKKKAQTIPPVTDQDMYKKIMIERFGWGKTLKFVTRAALGQKV